VFNVRISNWLRHTKIILDGVIRMAKAMVEGVNVLVHCSDGWDRTAQLSSLCQIVLDPYYRTIKGFEILIEKEWTSVGFKFEHRCGYFVHSTSHQLYNETSPVFIQFLDCVWQLLQQFPKEFEFTEVFLLDLYKTICECKFGTFLKNCDRERRVYFFSSLLIFILFFFFFFFSIFLDC